MQNSTISTQHFTSRSWQTDANFTQSFIKKLTDKELYQKCQLYGAEARKWTRKLSALLPEVERRQLYRKHGFYSIFEFAAKLAGMRHETVSEILRVAKKLEDKPLLLNKLEEQGVNKLRLIANIATKENEKMLAEKVSEMSKATLATFIQEKFRAGTEFNQNATINENTQTGFSGFIENDESIEPKIPQKISITIPLEPNVELDLREFQKKLSREQKAPIGLNEVIKTLLEIAKEKTVRNSKSVKPVAKITETTTSEPVDCETVSSTTNRIIEKPAILLRAQDDISKRLPVGMADKQKAISDTSPCAVQKSPSRYIPIKIKKILYQKYSGRCAYPGCLKLPEFFHHTLRFSLNPTHNSDYIVPLCKNHERLAHHSLIENEENSPENWKLKFEPEINTLKYKIDQKVISHYAPKAS